MFFSACQKFENMISLYKKEREMPVKRFISVLGSLLVLPAFAEVAPVYYDDVVEYVDDTQDVEKVDAPTQKNVQQRTIINRSTSASRMISSAQGASGRTNTASRAVAASPRTATTNASRGTVARSTNTSRAAVSSRNAAGKKPVVARVSANNTQIMGVSKALSGQPAQITYGTGSVYNANNKSGNSTIGMANRRASARLSTVVAPAATTTTPTLTQEEVTSTTNNLTAIAELTDYCKAQYAACMDNYCNVLDDNQGRCSCSKNVKNYEKTEQTLAQATEDFQNVVQQIRYIGLTSDQVESLFSETEAELSMKSNTDSSRLKNSLDAIKKKIVDVSSPSATSTAVTSGLSLDMNGLLTADFSAGFDLNSFLNMNNNNTASVSNQRGEQLYKTAASRCKTSVLNSCVAQGIEANIITNAYDLEIDKQCVLYERALNDANAEMKSNVTNAATILQQARLLLAQNKNSYDLRGCVAAIDSCMQDDYVCGPDYELCLDPTGKYLSNGEIIKGGTPGVSGGQTMNTLPATQYTYTGSLTSTQTANPATITATTNTYDKWYSNGMWNLYATWNYPATDCDGASDASAIGGQTSTGTYKPTQCNAWSFGPNENLGQYVDSQLKKWGSEYTKTKDTTQSDDMAMYLLQKIGYIDKNDKVHGMCASVFKQCQDYTFQVKKTKKSYIPDNEVIRQYLNMTLPKIKTQQDAILADYAEGCRTDVQSCLTSNGYEDSNSTSTASKTAINACAGEIATCMSVGGYQISDGAKLTLRAMSDWVRAMMITCAENYYLYDDGTTTECRPCGTADVFVNTNQNLIYDEGIYAATSSYALATLDNPNKPYQYVNANDDNLDEAYSNNGERVSAVTLVSAGGRATSCSCPEGYKDSVWKATSTASCSDLYVPGVGCFNGNVAGLGRREMGKSQICIDESINCTKDDNGWSCK